MGSDVKQKNDWSLQKAGRINYAKLFQNLENMVEFRFGGLFVGSGLGFGFGSRI